MYLDQYHTDDSCKHTSILSRLTLALRPLLDGYDHRNAYPLDTGHWERLKIALSDARTWQFTPHDVPIELERALEALVRIASSVETHHIR